MQKKKIGIFITEKEFVRNFINTGIVNKISKNNEVYVFYNENITFNLKKLTNCK